MLLRTKAARSQIHFSMTSMLIWKHGKVTRMEKHQHPQLGSDIKLRSFNLYMISEMLWVWINPDTRRTMFQIPAEQERVTVTH